MNITDFFALVLPASGHIVIAEQLEKGYRHFTTEALDTAVQKAVDLNFDHKNVFFHAQVILPNGNYTTWRITNLESLPVTLGITAFTETDF